MTSMGEKNDTDEAPGITAALVEEHGVGTSVSSTHQAPAVDRHQSLSISSSLSMDEVKMHYLSKKDGFWGPKVGEKIKCPHCSRQFAENAAGRHIPKCAVMKSKPRPPASSNIRRFTDSIGRRTGALIIEPSPADDGGEEKTLSGQGSGAAAEQGQKHLVPTPQQKESEVPSLSSRIEDQYAEVSLVMQDRTMMDSNESIDDLEQRCRRLTIFLAEMAVVAEKEKTDRGTLTKRYLKEEHGDLTIQAKSMQQLLKIKLGDDTDIELCRHSCLNILAFIANMREIDADAPAGALKNFLRESQT